MRRLDTIADSGFTNIVAVTVSGELTGTEVPNVGVLPSAAVLAKGAEQATPALSITIPKGTPAGGYTVTAFVDDDETFIEAADATPPLSASAILTVGDPGTGVDSVEFSFRKSHVATNATMRTCGPAPRPDSGEPSEDQQAVIDTERTDDASAPAEEPICLTVTVKNSLGKTANDDDIKLLFITTEGGTWMGTGVAEATPVLAVPAASRTAKYNFEVTAGRAAQVTVEVDAGPAEGTLDLTFTGGAAALSIGDASDVLARSNDAYTAAVEDDTPDNDTDDSKDAVEGGIIFEVMATDKAGNNIDLAPADVTAVKITDGDDKDVTSKFKTKYGMQYAMQKAGNPQVVQVRIGTTGTKVAAGEYTASVSLTEVVDSAVTATFNVADAPADVSLSASAMSSDTIGDVITVTATVTDENGKTVADGTPVDFDVSSSTGLAGIGKGHGADDTVGTEDGEASVKYAVVGNGNSVVSATAGGATGVVVIASTAGMTEPEAMPEEEASVACLSNLAGFATWACGVESSASEIFGLVSGRGATALHLWNGSAWVRYSVVDGTMVPGSSDFMVAENDILYISN